MRYESKAEFFMAILQKIKSLIRSNPDLYRTIIPIYWKLTGSQLKLYNKKTLNRFRQVKWDEIKELSTQLKGTYLMEPSILWLGNLLQRPQHMALAMGKIGFLSLYNDFGVPPQTFYEIGKNVFLTGPDKTLYSLPKVLRVIYSTCFPYTPKTINETRTDSQVIIYELVDDLNPEISGNITNDLVQLYRFMVRERNSDLVVVTAKKLMEQVINDGFPEEKVLYLPNGVEVEHFQNPPNISFDKNLSEFLQKFPVIVGYHGAIAPWLWFDVIQDLINMMKDVGFLFIGPLYDINKFPLRGDNVYWTGRVEYEVLPAYVKHYTIGWIPFKPGPIAKSTSPLKLFEYFASGKPAVVSSDMLECTQFPVVFSGNGTLELKQAIEQALEKSTDETFKKQLMQLAMEHTWENRARTLEQFLSQQVAIVS
ncbi:MAG: glycosyltransferase family 1 protein [Chlorobi bacterium]|nr:glycosyltransferase family 1 protein [Chlorobiota bacterium]